MPISILSCEPISMGAESSRFLEKFFAIRSDFEDRTLFVEHILR
jgi:hypothetical protein